MIWNKKLVGGYLVGGILGFVTMIIVVGAFLQ